MPASSRPDPARRSERSRRAILDAALELLTEHGYAELTIEAVAARAGVGKQTIYRWWSGKGAVVLDMMGKTVNQVISPKDSLVRWQVLIMVAGLDHGEIWADLQDTWSCLLDSKYYLTADWKDAMWDRAQVIDALPMVRGTLLGHPGHVIELHKYGATQVNLATGTRRPVRRVSVDLMHGRFSAL